jgi:hypothetical protein
LSFSWSPGGSQAPAIEATAGAPGTRQEWAVTVTDGGSGRAISRDVTVVSSPDTSACRAECESERNDCMASVSEPGGAPPQLCVQRLQRCLSACEAP